MDYKANDCNIERIFRDALMPERNGTPRRSDTDFLGEKNINIYTFILI